MEEQIRIIRKLGKAEACFHAQIASCGAINTSAHFIQSKLNLFQQLPAVNKAVRQLKRDNPILNSRVVRMAQTGAPAFAYMSNGQNEDTRTRDDDALDNVEFAYYQGSTKADIVAYCNLLLDRELNIPIDADNGPQWRYLFVQLPESKSSNLLDEYRYQFCLIFSASHAILDAPSGISIMVRHLFLNISAILDAQNGDGVLKENCENVATTEEPIIDSVEDYITKYVQTENLNLPAYRHIKPFKTPQAFIISNKDNGANSIAPTSNDPKEESNEAGFYSFKSNKRIASVKELIAISANSQTKYLNVEFDYAKFQSFLRLCKQKQVKLNSVFSLLFVIAWRMVYQKLLMTTNAAGKRTNAALVSEKINYSTIVNLRPYVDVYSIEQMSWFCTTLYSSNEHTLDITNEASFWAGKFWDACRHEGDEFHGRLKEGEMFQLLLDNKQLPPLADDETRVHFSMSNILFPSSVKIIEDSARFDYKSTFGVTSFSSKTELSRNIIVNANGRVTWAIFYNSYHVKKETIELFQRCVLQLYNRICDEQAHDRPDHDVKSNI
jgi:hypothetical protein